MNAQYDSWKKKEGFIITSIIIIIKIPTLRKLLNTVSSKMHKIPRVILQFVNLFVFIVIVIQYSSPWVDRVQTDPRVITLVG